MSISIRPICRAAALALCATAFLAPSARAEFYVPPENSAVNQYTQTVPSAGGDKSGEGKHSSAEETLGAGNAKRLQDQGPDGAAAAELAAATAPTPVGTESGEDAEAPAGRPQGKKSGKPHKGKREGRESQATGANGGGPSKPGGEGGGAAAGNGDVHGDSASGEVIGQATGLSDGSLGIFLPLAILAAIACAGAFLWRRRASDGPSGSLPH